MNIDVPYRLAIGTYLERKLEEIKIDKAFIITSSKTDIDVVINLMAYSLVVKNLEELSKQFLDYENYDIIIQKKSKVT